MVDVMPLMAKCPGLLVLRPQAQVGRVLPLQGPDGEHGRCSRVVGPRVFAQTLATLLNQF